MGVTQLDPVDPSELTNRRLAKCSFLLSCCSAALTILFISMIDSDRTFRTPVVTWHPWAATVGWTSGALAVISVSLAHISGDRIRLYGLFGYLIATGSLGFLMLWPIAIYED